MTTRGANLHTSPLSTETVLDRTSQAIALRPVLLRELRDSQQNIAVET